MVDNSLCFCGYFEFTKLDSFKKIEKLPFGDNPEIQMHTRHLIENRIKQKIIKQKNKQK